MRSARKIWQCPQPRRRCGRRCRKQPRSRLKETSMYSFIYHRPTTVRQAVNLLAKNEDAKLLAGGHSLIPVMKLRLANPPVIIDLSKVEGISGVELKGRSIVVGAMTKHVEVANSQVATDHLPA